MSQPQYSICGKEIMALGKMCCCLLPDNHVGECKCSPFVIDAFGNKVSPAIKPQLSVREKAREMFDEAIGTPKIFSPDETSVVVLANAAYNQALKEISNKAVKVIDQIITLAQEEREKEILQDLAGFLRGRHTVMSKDQLDTLLKSVYVKQ